MRQTGARVTTVRAGAASAAALDAAAADGAAAYDLAVLSPGPGTPSDFDVGGTLARLVELKVPVFGVCLGLQGIVEHFGGRLDVLDYPLHGKPSRVALVGAGADAVRGRDPAAAEGAFAATQADAGAGAADAPSQHAWKIFDGLPRAFEVARYHSLHGEELPADGSLRATALSDDGVVMAVEHTSLPIAAVQFHPESILTNPRHGLRILDNCLKHLSFADVAGAPADAARNSSDSVGV